MKDKKEGERGGGGVERTVQGTTDSCPCFGTRSLATINTEGLHGRTTTGTTTLGLGRVGDPRTLGVDPRTVLQNLKSGDEGGVRVVVGGGGSLSLRLFLLESTGMVSKSKFLDRVRKLDFVTFFVC